MVDTVEQQNIKGLEINKAVKGFALGEYVFKPACQIVNTTADSIRWYQETAADLTATSPSVVANVSPLSQFPTLEVSWTRNTSYVRKYADEGFISMEDIKSADVDVLARTLLRLTRAVVKQVDTRIWNVLTENQAAGVPNINMVDVGVALGWASSSSDPIKNILNARRLIEAYDYNTQGARLFINPLTHQNLMVWLVSTKGSSIPQYASEKVTTGVIMSILGVNVVVSNNVSTSGACLMIPQQSITWKSYQDTTSAVIEEKGIGSKIRVWEIGEAILTDPKSVCYLSGI
jgi:hypothetical protein